MKVKYLDEVIDCDFATGEIKLKIGDVRKSGRRVEPKDKTGPYGLCLPTPLLGFNSGEHRYMRQGRAVWLMSGRKIPPYWEVIAINGNAVDSRLSNLRAAPTWIRVARNRSPTCNSTSGVRGVSWDSKRKRYEAEWRNKRVGRFITLKDAEYAREKARESDPDWKAFWSANAELPPPTPGYRATIRDAWFGQTKANKAR